jgi:hypothetical protein
MNPESRHRDVPSRRASPNGYDKETLVDVANDVARILEREDFRGWKADKRLEHRLRSSLERAVSGLQSPMDLVGTILASRRSKD